jgi:hypothetical protein
MSVTIFQTFAWPNSLEKYSMTNDSYVVTFEEDLDRLKVVIPLRINWPLLLLFTFTMLIWLAMLIIVLVYIVRGMSTNFVLTILLVLWMIIWFLFGRFLFARWQYYAANREILFVDEEQLILRRPVSILGITTSYDINHITPFYFSDKHRCAAFDYAYLHVYFGRSMDEETSLILIDDLNQRYFPDSFLD